MSYSDISSVPSSMMPFAIVVPNEDAISATSKPLGAFFVFSPSEEVLWLWSTDPFTNPSLIAIVDLGCVTLRSILLPRFADRVFLTRIVNGFTTFGRRGAQSRSIGIRSVRPRRFVRIEVKLNHFTTDRGETQSIVFIATIRCTRQIQGSCHQQ